MKFRKTFFITFIGTYLIIGYLASFLVGIKWDESASTLTKFLVRTEMALTDGYLIKVFISLMGSFITDFISNRK